MKNSIKLSDAAWAKIYNQLAKDYPPSYIIIREKMKNKLGFVARRHKEYVSLNDQIQIQYTIYLDFYDPLKQSMFYLKYSDFL